MAFRVITHSQRSTNAKQVRRPSLISPHQRISGLGDVGEVNGIFGDFGKSLKRIGFGAVKFATGGIYNPDKNRFLVPFTGAQVRNAISGQISFFSGGMVKPDKFLDSKTGRILGNIGAGAEAAAVTAGATSYFSAPAPLPTGSVPMVPAGSAVPSSASLAPSVFADPTPMMTQLPSGGWNATSLMPATEVTAPTSSFATAPTGANAWGAAPMSSVPAPALLQSSGAESLWGSIKDAIPSGDAITKGALTTLSVADTASRILGRTAGAALQAGGTTVQTGGPGVLQPYGAYANPYGSSGGGSSPYGEDPVDSGSLMPWLAVGGAVIAGYFLLKKKKK